MKTLISVLLTVGVAGAAVAGPPRSALQRDVEGYAVAACLLKQKDPALRRQGEGWASVVVQGGRGDPSLLAPVQRAVEAEMARSGVPVAHLDGGPDGDIALPVMWCAQMPDRPAVRAAITRAEARLAPAYRGRR